MGEDREMILFEGSLGGRKWLEGNICFQLIAIHRCSALWKMMMKLTQGFTVTVAEAPLLLGSGAGA